VTPPVTLPVTPPATLPVTPTVTPTEDDRDPARDRAVPPAPTSSVVAGFRHADDIRGGMVASSPGFVLGVDKSSATVDVVSANVADFLGRGPDAVLGRALGDLMSPAMVARLPLVGSSDPDGVTSGTVRLPHPGRPGVDDARPPGSGRDRSGRDGSGRDRSGRDRSGRDGSGRDRSGRDRREPTRPPGRRRPGWARAVDDVRGGRARRRQPLVLVFRSTVDEDEDESSLRDSFRHTLDRLRAIDRVSDLCVAAAEEGRALTGYDRVGVYRFASEVDPRERLVAECVDATGSVSSERSVPGARSVPYQHLRAAYHHSDQGGVHVVADLKAASLRLTCAPGVATQAELDAMLSSLSTLFPADRLSLHDVQGALQGAGVAAVMTMPLILKGTVWGLLVCLHHSPRQVPPPVRNSFELFGRVLALQLHGAYTREDQQRWTHLSDLVSEVLAAMSEAASLVEGVQTVPTALVGLAAADGAVLELDGVRATAGRVPAPALVDTLMAVTGSTTQEVQSWGPPELAGLLGSTPPDPFVANVLRARIDDRSQVLWFRGRRGFLSESAAPPWDDEPPGSGRGLERAQRGGEPLGTPAAPGGRAPAQPGGRAPAIPVPNQCWSAAEHAAAVMFVAALPALMLQQTQRTLLVQELAATATRELLEHQLQQHQRLESMGQLAGGVAHDFNNLLAIILSYTEFVADAVREHDCSDPDESWVSVGGDIEHIKAATARAADLTRQLLTFARREVVRPQVLDLNEVLSGLHDLLDRTLGGRVELRSDLAADLPPVLADRGQIEQVLLNLVVNARDAMPGGGSITVATAIVDRPAPRPGPLPGDPASRNASDAAPDTGSVAGASGPWVCLRVRDTGTGMPQDVIDRVFDPFFTTKSAGNGTGLGLATVHGIVTQAGGLIDIESRLGAGTTFTVTFPATQSAAVAAPAPTGVRGRGRGQTVLVVEDSDDLRELTCRLLTGAGYTVLAASNGPDALALADHHDSPVDLLLTDLSLPGMTGNDLAVAARRRHPSVRVVFMSGYAQLVLAADGGLPPDQLLLDKPFSRTTLLAAIQETLARRTVR